MVTIESIHQAIIHEYLPVIWSSMTVYIFIVVAVRLFGKKEFAQLSVADMVFVLLISNAVQNAMVGSNTSLMGGLVAATTLFSINYVFQLLLYRFPRFRKLLSGEPKVLIYKGIVHEDNLAKAHISINELLETVREHGCASIHDVNLAMLESDGNISVLSNNYERKTLHSRKQNK